MRKKSLMLAVLYREGAGRPESSRTRGYRNP